MRPYQTEDDYWRIRAFLRQAMLRNGMREKSWHVARLDYWRWHGILNQGDGQLDRDVFLWETEEGQIAGVLDWEEAGNAYLQVHPRLRTTELEEEMITLAEEHLAVQREGKQMLAVWLDSHLLTSVGTECTARLWHVASGQVVHTLRHGDGLYDVTFSPDGSLLASAGCHRTVKLWDVAGRRLLRSLSHGDEVMGVAFSPDGTLNSRLGRREEICLLTIKRSRWFCSYRFWSLAAEPLRPRPRLCQPLLPASHLKQPAPCCYLPLRLRRQQRRHRRRRLLKHLPLRPSLSMATAMD
jgi:hypothetical protein